MSTKSKEPGWKDLPIGGLITKPATSTEYKTGAWRSARPVWDAEKCSNCLLCWIFCPDSAIILDEEGKMTGVDLDYCKGCGICAAECPPKIQAFEMVDESEFRDK